METIYNSADDPLFTEAEVTEIVNTQNNAKSPGEDGFNAQIIKNLHKTEPLFLTKLYNKCLTLGVFPDIWKSSVGKVIRKSGKRDFRNAKSYRPISLLSVFAKILEKLLINHTIFYLKSNNLLDENQYGFTPQKSSIDAIFSAIDFIQLAFEMRSCFAYCFGYNRRVRQLLVAYDFGHIARSGMPAKSTFINRVLFLRQNR